MKAFLNAAKQMADVARAQTLTVRMGIVTGYDPDLYAVKVAIAGLDIITPWIPLKALAVGDGFGILAAPNLGDAVSVHFFGGTIDCATVGLRFFGDGAAPPQVAAGEYLIKHRSGALLQFAADGSVQIVTSGDLAVQVGGDASFKVAGAISSEATAWNHKGAMNVIGNIAATGSIVDRSLTNTKSVGDLRDAYDIHTHTHGDAAGTTSTPTPTV